MLKSLFKQNDVQTIIPLRFSHFFHVNSQPSFDFNLIFYKRNTLRLVQIFADTFPLFETKNRRFIVSRPPPLQKKRNDRTFAVPRNLDSSSRPSILRYLAIRQKREVRALASWSPSSWKIMKAMVDRKSLLTVKRFVCSTFRFHLSPIYPPPSLIPALPLPPVACSSSLFSFSASPFSFLLCPSPHLPSPFDSTRNASIRRVWSTC